MSTRDELAADLRRALDTPNSVNTIAGWLIAEGWRKKPDALAVLAVVNALGVDWLYDDPGTATEAILALMDRGQ